MFDRDHLIALHLEALALLGWSPPAGSDAFDELARGGFLTTSQAATICGGLSGQAIRDWIAHAASIGRPIAHTGATWIVITARLLDYVEKWRGGKPARVAVENRLREHWPKWSQPPELRTGAEKRAAGCRLTPG